MSKKVCAGAKIRCSFGSQESQLIVIPNPILVKGKPAATIMDHAPMVNIMPFGECKTPSNPVVQAMIISSQGAKTTAPCIPATPAPWIPGSATVLHQSKPALHNDSKCICIWGGVIEITDAGQTTVEVGK